MSTLNKEQQAREIVKQHVLISMGAGLVPIPILDIVAVGAVQLDMVKNLARLYEVNFSTDFVKNLVASMTGSTLARIGASAIKAIPGLGSIIGGVSMSIMSGASTYAVGQVFSRHFREGGGIYDFDPEMGKDYYQKYYEEGKDVAAEWEKEKDKQKQAVDDDQNVLDRLERLADLKEKGVLSEEEFQKMKEKLLGD